MTLTEFATPLAAKNNFIKASFGGFAGSGKTRTASEFVIGAYKELKCTKPVLFIDNEKGSRFLVPLFQKSGIETLVKDTLELADVLKAFEYLNKGHIDFLFIDSLSKIWYKYVRDYKAKNRRTFMTLQDWGKILPAWQEEFSDRFVELSGNCVFTGRGGYTYDMEETTEGNGRKKKEFVKSGVKMKMAGETPFEPDLNIWMEQEQIMNEDNKVIKVNRNAMIMKDRSGLIDGKIFANPTYDNFKEVVTYLINVPKGDVAGKTSDENLAPSEEYDDRRQKREIEMEKVKACFDEQGIGTSKEDKMHKVMILKKFFGTSSQTELEKMKIKDLEESRSNLEDFFKDWSLVEDSDKMKHINDYTIPLSFQDN